MYLIPSRGRPDKVERLIASGRPTERGLIIIDADQLHAYEHIKMPANWQLVAWPAARIGDHFNHAFKEYPDEPWYALGADDLLPPAGWDAQLAARISPTDIIWPNSDSGRCTHPVIGGDLVRCAGWLAAPGLKHFYVDNVWHEIAQRLRCTGLMDIVVPHLHFTNGGAAYDETYRNRPPVDTDRVMFEAFMRNHFDELTGRMLCLKSSA